jgi:hypothetical protein
MSPVLPHEEHLLFQLVLFLVQLVDFLFQLQNIFIRPLTISFKLFSCQRDFGFTRMFFRGLDKLNFFEQLELSIPEFLDAFLVDEVLLFEGFEHLRLGGVE